jgi:hypothetical protein
VVTDTRGAMNDVSASGAHARPSTDSGSASADSGSGSAESAQVHAPDGSGGGVRPMAASAALGRAALRRAAANAKAAVDAQGAVNGGGVAVMFGITAVGALFGFHTFQGILFCLACLFAAATTRKSDLLTVAVSPPAIFFAVSLIAGVLGGLGDHSFMVSVLVSVGTALTENAPWLFLGTLLMVGVTLPRGLLRNLTDLRVRVAADNPFRLADSRLRRRAEDPVQWDEDVSPRRRR